MNSICDVEMSNGAGVSKEMRAVLLALLTNY